MFINDEYIAFIQEHLQADVNQLRLKKHLNKSFDVAFAIDQIEIRKKIKNKLPTWHKNYRLLFPSTISSEQSSSEITANYKKQLLKGESFCDLTGGLGIDSFYFSQKATQATYIERYAPYCKIAKHNFEILEANNITVENRDCIQYLNETENEFGTFYIDPARRGDMNRKVYAFQDCEPNIIEILPILKKRSKRIIIKASPMIDISQSLEILPDITRIDVISVKNECKEVLFIVDDIVEINGPIIRCINYLNEKEYEDYSFAFRDEKNISEVLFATSIKQYVYEPNASILKAGAFKSLTRSFQIEKLQINSHLYTSSLALNNFPGRKFEVINTLEFSNRSLKSLKNELGKANITVRNFPISAEELRKRTQLEDGGDIYLFATMLYRDRKVIIICRKIQNPKSSIGAS